MLAYLDMLVLAEICLLPLPKFYRSELLFVSLSNHPYNTSRLDFQSIFSPKDTNYSFLSLAVSNSSRPVIPFHLLVRPAMPGRSSVKSSPWRSRPRRGFPHGSSRGQSRVDLQRGSRGDQQGEPRTGSVVSSRGSSCTPRRSRGSSARAFRGSRGTSSVVGPHHTSPIFSSPRGNRVPSLEGNSPSTGRYVEDIGYRNHPMDTASRLALPSNERFLPSIAAGVESGNDRISLQPSTSEHEAPLLLGREATAQVERRNEVLMAVSLQVKGVLGCAYYSTDENSLFLLQDMSCTEPLQFVEMLMLHIQPTIVLLPLKVPDVVLQFFESYQSNVDRG